MGVVFWGKEDVKGIHEIKQNAMTTSLCGPFRIGSDATSQLFIGFWIESQLWEKLPLWTKHFARVHPRKTSACWTKLMNEDLESETWGYSTSTNTEMAVEAHGPIYNKYDYAIGRASEPNSPLIWLSNLKSNRAQPNKLMDEAYCTIQNSKRRQHDLSHERTCYDGSSCNFIFVRAAYQPWSAYRHMILPRSDQKLMVAAIECLLGELESQNFRETLQGLPPKPELIHAVYIVYRCFWDQFPHNWN
ncbi:hypothetical protein VNO77_19974 [Canavalia gladiata]|uniref:Uncharacterized protein n=1 Tax=Canavalia gladiata TaxID=3824 RepID=A0AAN9LNH6_CANGL